MRRFIFSIIPRKGRFANISSTSASDAGTYITYARPWSDTEHPIDAKNFAASYDGKSWASYTPDKIFDGSTKSFWQTEVLKDGEEPYFYEDEAEFFEMRSRIFSEVQNREKPFAERIKNAFRILGSEVPEFDLAKWAEICLGLERLDESWTGVLENIIQNPAPPEISDETAAEQLFCYFLFRHFCPEYQKTSLAFCLLSFFMTEKAAEQTGISEAARLWSSETEYSSENKPLLLSTLFEEGVQQ